MSSAKKKICVITAARSEYGPLRWIIDMLHKDTELQLQLVVTGGHLLPDQGNTYKEIEKDGYPIAAKVDMQLQMATTTLICESMGRCATGMAKTFSELKPDMLVVLGDRYELLPICSTALVMGIPIAHISGGDVTEGALDDSIRNAITMMATLHFPGTEDSAKNIIRMRNSDINVYTVGEPSIDNFNRLTLLSREELSANLQIPENSKWVLMTYHPETKRSLEDNLSAVKDIITALDRQDGISVVITKANIDFAGEQINDFLQTVVDRNPEKYKLYPSLGQLRYLSFMKQIAYVIGNSSSGITEAPFLEIPSVNVGDRQTGRHLCGNVQQCHADVESIVEAINASVSKSVVDKNYWGDGHTAEKIVSIIKTAIR